MAIQVQLQILLAAEGAKAVVPRPNIKSNVEVAKPQIFDGAASKVLESLIACKLFIRMRMRKVAVEE